MTIVLELPYVYTATVCFKRHKETLLASVLATTPVLVREIPLSETTQLAVLHHGRSRDGNPIEPTVYRDIDGHLAATWEARVKVAGDVHGYPAGVEDVKARIGRASELLLGGRLGHRLGPTYMPFDDCRSGCQTREVLNTRVRDWEGDDKSEREAEMQDAWRRAGALVDGVLHVPSTGPCYTHTRGAPSFKASTSWLLRDGSKKLANRFHAHDRPWLERALSGGDYACAAAETEGADITVPDTIDVSDRLDLRNAIARTWPTLGASMACSDAMRRLTALLLPNAMDLSLKDFLRLATLRRAVATGSDVSFMSYLDGMTAAAGRLSPCASAEAEAIVGVYRESQDSGWGVETLPEAWSVTGALLSGSPAMSSSVAPRSPA